MTSQQEMNNGGARSLTYNTAKNLWRHLLDPGALGSKFTWCRFAGNRIRQMRRLDRVFWNVQAQLAFLEAKVAVLLRLYSDHNPILFIEEADNPPDRSLQPVHFEAAWLTREDYKLIWEEAVASKNRPSVLSCGNTPKHNKKTEFACLITSESFMHGMIING